MSNLNSDLIARIYAASDTPLTNEELYREVQRETGMSDAELQKMKAFGSGQNANQRRQASGSLVSADAAAGRGDRACPGKAGRLALCLQK